LSNRVSHMFGFTALITSQSIISGATVVQLGEFNYQI